ncbi:MAG: hypothetical protein LVQ95_00340 [Candidatus Micrarchaeales archaeon]|nr:hypothetical protein [Candidatus Micrarchaeales archaeon]
MVYAPTKVKDAFAEVKKIYPFRIVLRSIYGKYYVYKDTGVYDKTMKKSRVISEYLGKITEEGKFIKKWASVENALERAKLLIKKHGGTVFLPREETNRIEFKNEEKNLNKVDASLLTVLSMNARADLAHYGKKLGLRSDATYNRIKQLEKRYSINYLPEIDASKLGYLQYIAFVKFRDKRPDMIKLTAIFHNESNVQFAVATSGKYDIIVIFLAKNNSEASEFIYALRKKGEFSGYLSEWYLSTIDLLYGCARVRANFFDQLIENEPNENLRGKKAEMQRREYKVLKELCADGSVDFSKIDKKYGFDNGRADYTYTQLKDRGIIKRMTLTMSNLPIKHISIFIVKDLEATEWENGRELLFREIIDMPETALINKYSAVGTIGMPGGVIMILPIFREGYSLEIEGKIRKYIKHAEIEILTIEKTLAGSLCYRRFDNTYSKQYNRLVQEYGFKKLPIINYEETGRLKKQRRLRGFRGEQIDENEEEAD